MTDQDFIPSRKHPQKIKEVWAKKAVEILLKEIKHIKSVNSWAHKVGHTRAWLGKYIKEVYGLPPKQIIRKVRYEKILQEIKNHTNGTSRFIASLSGLQDEKSLYKFLKRHYNTNFTEIRRKIIYQSINKK